MLISSDHQFSNILGSGGQTEALVVIPGFMADARSFVPQIVELGATRPIIVLTAGLADTVEKTVAEAGPALSCPVALRCFVTGWAATSRSSPHADTRTPSPGSR
jgi:hypothetical protein